MSEKSTEVLPEDNVELYDSYIPSIPNGDYVVEVKSNIEGINTDDYFKEPIKQNFSVNGIQFSLPENEIESVYPAQGNEADYTNCLPHIVFNRRGLPWERYIKVSGDELSWLCLLVFTEEQLEIDPETKSELRIDTVENFLKDEEKSRKPKMDRPGKDILGSQCKSIRIKYNTFLTLRPSLVEELKYLAHVRKVSVSGQVVSNEDDPGWYSVIIGNRILRAETSSSVKYHIHLVSLEGHEEALLGPNGQNTDDEFIDLISLFNWTCVSNSQTPSSKELIDNIRKNKDQLLFRHNIDLTSVEKPEQEELSRRFENGYIPLSYIRPNGEKSYAWYRGPFIPIKNKQSEELQDYSIDVVSPLGYDEKIAAVDQTYKTAWSIGKMLALSNKEFCQAIMRFRKNSYLLFGKLEDVVNYNLPHYLSNDLSKNIYDDLIEGINSFSNIDVNKKNALPKILGKDMSQILKKYKQEILKNYLPLILKKYIPEIPQSYSSEWTKRTGLSDILHYKIANAINNQLVDEIQSGMQSSSNAISHKLIQAKLYGLINQTVSSVLRDNLTQIKGKSFARDHVLEILANGIGQELSVKLNSISSKEQNRLNSDVKYKNNTSFNLLDMKTIIFNSPLSEDLAKSLSEDFIDDFKIIVENLVQYSLLNHIPLHYLIPEESMLPKETLRFFYIDENWLYSLIEGALGSGVQSSQDVHFKNLIKIIVNQELLDKVPKYRNAKFNLDSPDDEANIDNKYKTGVLIRSCIISEYAGANIKAFKISGDKEQLMNILRIDRLTPEILLVIFQGVPDKILISSPAQGLHFCIPDEADIDKKLTLDINHLTAFLGIKGKSAEFADKLGKTSEVIAFMPKDK